MDNPYDTVDYVAPLHIVKSRSKATRKISINTRQDSLLNMHSTISNRTDPLSPPQTPKEQDEHAKVEVMQSAQGEQDFPNYLRATHHFQPSSKGASAADSSITIPISPGEVILVHSIHSNGWADGSLLLTGARGWLPTNYCETFSHPSINNILDALTHLWDLVQSIEHSGLSLFNQQDYVRRMIAGVRHFLVSDAKKSELPYNRTLTRIIAKDWLFRQELSCAGESCSPS